MDKSNVAKVLNNLNDSLTRLGYLRNNMHDVDGRHELDNSIEELKRTMGTIEDVLDVYMDVK